MLSAEVRNIEKKSGLTELESQGGNLSLHFGQDDGHRAASAIASRHELRADSRSSVRCGENAESDSSSESEGLEGEHLQMNVRGSGKTVRVNEAERLLGRNLTRCQVRNPSEREPFLYILDYRIV